MRPNFVGYRILDNTVMFAVIAKISQVYAGHNTLVIEIYTVGDHKIEVASPQRIFVVSPDGRFWQEHQKQWQRIEVAIPELAGFEYVNHIAAREDRHLITCQLIPTKP